MVKYNYTMAEITLNSHIIIRNDTAENWANSTLILGAGEPARASDTNVYKVGDGVNIWNNLPISAAPYTYQPKIYQITTSTAIGTAAKVATLDGYTPAIGDLIALKLTNGNSAASPTLNINGQGALGIRINNVAANTTVCTLAANSVILLYFDGTYLHMMGSQRTTDTDTNTDTYDRTYWNNTITAGVAIYDYKLLMQGRDGKFYPLTLETGTGTTKTVSTQEFLINSPILYYNTTTDVAANGTTANVYSEIPTTNLHYTANQASWTSQLPIYLKGSINSAGNFVLDNTSYTSFITQTLPTVEDGFVYILLGYMYSTTGLRLCQYHPIYEYKNGVIRLYVPPHVHTFGNTAGTFCEGNDPRLLGGVYAAAISGGYTGTETEFYADLAAFANFASELEALL